MTAPNLTMTAQNLTMTAMDLQVRMMLPIMVAIVSSDDISDNNDVKLRAFAHRPNDDDDDFDDNDYVGDDK